MQLLKSESQPNIINPKHHLYRLPLLVETLEIKKVDNPHHHDYTQIWYVLDGKMRQVIGDREYIQNKGACTVILPYTSHNIDTLISDVQPKVLSLSFTDNFFIERGYKFFSYANKKARFEARSVPTFFEFFGKKRERADELAMLLLSEFAKHEKMSFDSLCKHLADFLDLLCVEASHDSEERITCTKERANAITNAVRYMSVNFGKKITLDELCSVATMSRRMFTENFKAVTGTTSAKYLLNLRLTHARYLLLYSDKTVSTIASEVGFHDKMRLAHVFSENIGMTPTEYRKQLRPEAIESDLAYQKRWQWFNESDFKPVDFRAKLM